MSCIFCKRIALNGIELSDGNIIHKDCYERAKKELNDLHREIDDTRKMKRDAEEEETVLDSIFRFFSGRQRKYTQHDIDRFQKRLEAIQRRIPEIKRELEYVHDYMLEYPPDWDDRRKQLYDYVDGRRWFGMCEICGETYHLQVHHIIPLSKGGSNKVSNLRLLCRECHLKEHNKEDFGEKEYRKLALQDKIELITEAIEKHRNIEFYYQKPTDQVPIKRTVRPAGFSKAWHRFNTENFTLCVDGFCFTRKDNRTFALKRITRLKII